MPSIRKNSKRKKEPRPPQKDWTVMVYMAAAKDVQTEQSAIRDIKELQKVGTTSRVNVIVQIDRQWPGYPERYGIHKGRSEPIPIKTSEGLRPSADSSSSNTGDPKPLRGFLQWARTACRAKRYLLVLWGHAYGLGFGRDHGDQLTLKELASALAPFKASGKLDLLGANACAMSYAEAAYELRNSAQFMVASEISVPYAGWPYEEILRDLVRNPQMKAAALGKKIIERYVESLGGQNVALTLLDLKKAGGLRSRVSALARAVTASLRRDRTRNQTIDAFLDTAHGDVRPLIDLLDLCEHLQTLPDKAVKKAAGDMMSLLDKKAGFDLTPDPETDPGPELDGLNGLGIFAPAVTGEATLTKLELHKDSYNELALVKAKDNLWSKLVYADLKRHLEPQNELIAEFVNGTGAVRPEDRTGVAQLVLSIGRAFVKLETARRQAETLVDNVLEDDGAIPAPTGREKAVASARFGPPYLRLARSPRVPYGAISTPLGNEHSADDGGGGGEAPKGAASRFVDRVTSVAQSLATLEDALANVEKVAKRVMTNGRLGLGDTEPDVKGGGLGTEPDVKGGGLGDTEPDVKGGGLGTEPDVKGGGLGILAGTLPGIRLTPTTNGASGATDLFRQVAWSLRLLEDAVARLEGVVHDSLTDHAIGTRADQEYKKRVGANVRQAVGEVKEMAINAKQIAFWVLVHPTYGLGPGIQPGLGAASRQHLAVLGGLSSRYLRLL